MRILLLLSILCLSNPALAQTSVCTRDDALGMIRQQVELAKSFNPTQRITTLIRAADLLWPYQQDKARAVFTEAFDLAIETEKDEAKRSQALIVRMQVPDQRYVVIRAVAKRDSAWAKELIQQLVKLDTEAEMTPARDSLNNNLTAARLMQSAWQMLATDSNAALELARASLNYPASFLLTRFLYDLAAINQQAADQYYAQALAVYGDKPMREFLYLQAYPFAWRESLNTPSFVFHDNIPANFVPNRSLQRRFVQVFLRRAQQTLDVPLDEKDSYWDPSGAMIPSSVSVLRGLMRLEPDVRESLPDLLPELTATREKILVSLSVENQKLFLQPGHEASIAPDKTFDEEIEAAQKESDVYERDQRIATEVLGSRKEILANVIQAIDKISDSSLRADLLEWLYFQRAKSAVESKQFDEAEKLTSKVEGQEQRAFLHAQIAKGLLSRDATRAREMLELAITEANKAGATIFAARTLLTTANLYAKIDLSRSIEVLADAVTCINRIDTPDFVSDDQTLKKTPKRKRTGGQYGGEYMLRFPMPGLDPETAFREMAKIDFNTSLVQSSSLKDKFQRAMSTLALAEVCLQQSLRKKPKPAASLHLPQKLNPDVGHGRYHLR
jgi:hypothetical protein